MSPAEEDCLLAHLNRALQRAGGHLQAHTVVIGWREDRDEGEIRELENALQNLPHPAGKKVRVKTLARLTGMNLEEDAYLIFDTEMGYTKTYWTPGLTEGQLEIYTQLRADGMALPEALTCTEALEPEETK